MKPLAMATRPRNSILNLFDPLTTPTRDAPSPDSDKENSSPSAAFFGRTQKQPAPVLLTRRLVDVGDVTIDDPSMLMMLTDEDHLEGADDDDDTVTISLPKVTPTRSCFAPSPSTTRTPLGELVLERDITPIARTKLYKRPAPLTVAPSDFTTTVSDVPFASTCVNNQSITSLPFLHINNTPEITISPDARLPDSAPIISPPPSSKSFLRPHPSNSSSRDRNRCSIDLHASFQLHLQSEETSFDLLNDKVSFFTSSAGMDSFLNAMDADDSFDMAVEEANLERALEKLRLEDNTAEERGNTPFLLITN